MLEVFIDFETFSYADLPEVGTYRYFEHPSTEALCYAVAVDDDPVQLYAPDMRSSNPNGYLEYAPGVSHMRDDIVFIAHHCDFERLLMRTQYGIDIPINKWVDTAAMAARMSLPRSLEELAVFFGLDVTAKLDANTAKKGDSVCRPRPPSKHNPETRWTPHTKPEAFQALYKRCVLDVELCREVYRKLLQLEEQERKIWLLTNAMNERGVEIDLAAIPAAREVLKREGEPLIAELAQITSAFIKGGLRPTQNVKLGEFLHMESIDKSHVREGLRDPLTDPIKRRCLEIIQILSKSSIAKLSAMEARAHEDRRVRGSFLYAGAERTLRWSSGGVQFQNLKRGLGAETDVAFSALKAGSLEAIFDGAPRPAPDPALTPTGTIAEMLKGFLLGPFFIGDYAQIEARIIAWLAEDWEQIELFKNKLDPYCAMASDIYKVKVTKADSMKRFIGKQAELSCGFGVGPDKFAFNLYDKFDIEITEEFAEQIVAAYRARHPKITHFWDRMRDGFVHVIATRKERIKVTRNIAMGFVVIGKKNFAWIELPNGRKMYYADPKLEPGKDGPSATYFGRHPGGGGWGTVRTYGGKIAENATQAYAREVIAEGMLRLADAGYILNMTVHDEVVSKFDPHKSLKDFKEKMEFVEDHAKGLPIEVDTFVAVRYRK